MGMDHPEVGMYGSPEVGIGALKRELWRFVTPKWEWNPEVGSLSSQHPEVGLVTLKWGV